MEKLEKYRQFVEQIIREYGQYKPAYGEVEVQMIFDRENDHYQLMNVGWDDYERIRGCVLQIDLKNGKIWIQHNGSEDHIAEYLVAKGVSR